MKKIYFFCSGDSNRAQIAEAFANIYFKENFEAISTSYPDEKPILQETIALMNEIGIDMTNMASPKFDRAALAEADYIISICENPMTTNALIREEAVHLHIQVEEPTAVEDLLERRKLYRKVRDTIGMKMKEIAKLIRQPQLNCGKTPDF